MEYRHLGRSGVQVSALCLGCMNFGDRTSEEDSIRIIHAAIDKGLFFIDTADTYSDGLAEEIVGKALAEDNRRDKVVLATKVTGFMGRGPNDGGSSRYTIRKHCEASLRRLKTDHIDLYQLHWMDLNTPLYESLRMLDDLVREGKVLYVGCSKFAPALTTEAILTQERYGWVKFISEQPPFNLLDRRIENELLWNCQRLGMGVIPWAPIAAGILSGKYAKDAPLPADARFHRMGGSRLNDKAMSVAEQIGAMAAEKGFTAAEFALAWVLRQPGITAPIIGVRTMEQLESSLKALDVKFTDEDFHKINQIVPPGTAVSDYFDQNVYSRVRVASKIPGDHHERHERSRKGGKKTSAEPAPVPVATN